MPFKHSALAIKGGKIIATGENGYKGRKFSRSMCTTHAEVNCIQNIKCARRKRGDITICSFFEGAYLKNSKPCFNCCRSLLDFGIRRIRYFDGVSWIDDDIEVVMETAVVSSGDRSFSK